MSAEGVAAGLAGLGLGTIADVVLLTGGASMETWALVADGAQLILRRRGGAPAEDHPGKKPPLDREAEVIAAAVTAGVPAPEVVRVCTPHDGLGEAYVMRRVAGETLGKRIVRDAAFAPARAVLARQCGAALARIHATPPPQGLETVDAAATLGNYEATWRASGAVRPAIEAAFRWLERRLPAEPVAPRLVHGDFQIGRAHV